MQHERFISEHVAKLIACFDMLQEQREDQSRPPFVPRVGSADIQSHRRNRADFENVVCPEGRGKVRSGGKGALSCPYPWRKSFVSVKRRLGPRWPWSRFQFGTMRQKRRSGMLLFVLGEQDNREIQRLDLPPHVLHLQLFSTQTCKYSLRVI